MNKKTTTDTPLFTLKSKYQPSGDQPEAIKAITKGLKEGQRYQTLLGATGTGKTFTMANVIQQYNKPTLILAHNKTLTAQLAAELREFFPDHAVDYFVSYYDYYQPEAYNSKTDTYIEKDALINEEIDKFRHKATTDLITRKDVIIVASVSCIYGLGNPDEYKDMMVEIKVGDMIKRSDFFLQLVQLQYSRNDTGFTRGCFRVIGDMIDVFPAFAERPFRIELFGDEIEKIQEFDPTLGEYYDTVDFLKIYPGKHALVSRQSIEQGIEKIKEDLQLRSAELRANGRIAEAQRLEQRTEYDMEMMLETGYVSGIENYSHYFSGAKVEDPPFTLIDYFPDDFLMIIDESHMSLPQVGAMYEGNRSRKQSLIDYGFRLPSSLSNRPLKFDEFLDHMNHCVFVSATPGKHEKALCNEEYIEQIIRPTGLLDPIIDVRPSEHQIDDLLNEIRIRIQKNERSLVTTLTKKQAEDLQWFLMDVGIKSKYIHSDIDTIERIEILRELRMGTIDVVVGINLLREGLDLPEVSLVAILDANKQGFLRSRDALLQTIGRAARNSEWYVIMYGDTISDAMDQAIGETRRRRAIQEAYNEKHGITPKTIIKDITDIASELKSKKDKRLTEDLESEYKDLLEDNNKKKRQFVIQELETKMDLAVKDLDFEKAADLRDQIELLKR